MEDEKWTIIVEKLLRKAEDNATNDYERDSLLAKAAQIAILYGISESAARSRSGDRIETITISIGGVNSNQRWQLLAVISKIFGCRDIRLANSTLVRIYGFKHDLNIAQNMYNSVLVQMYTALAGTDKPEWIHGKTFNHSFINGYIDAASKILEAAYNKATKETPGSELVISDRETAIARRFEKDFPKRSKHVSVGANSAYAYNQGKNAAAILDVGRTRIRNEQRAIELR